MAETIITKTCTKCKQVKPLSEFYKSPTGKDGHNTRCKKYYLEICKKYQRTEKGKKIRKRANVKYNQSEKGRNGNNVREKKYRYTDKYLAKIERRNHKYREKHPLYRAMTLTVYRAVKKGILPHPTNRKCSQCGESAIEYHHHLGNERKHWLDVIPVCRLCHVHLHISQREAIVRIEVI